MEYTLDQKKRIHTLLQDGTIKAHFMYVSKNLNASGISCRTYYNRAIHEITEDNQGSFKKITIKFTPTDAELTEMRKISPVYTEIIFMAYVGDKPCGILYRHVNEGRAKEELPARSVEFAIEINLEN